MTKKSTTSDKSLSGMKNLENVVNNMANKNNDTPMTLDKLAQITSHGFSEMNEKFEKMDNKIDKKIDGLRTELKADIKDVKTELKADIKDVKNDIGEINKDIFSFERIQMAKVERDDRQDLKIKQLETKCCK